MKHKNLSLRFQLFIGCVIFISFVSLISFLFWRYSNKIEKEVKHGEKISEFLENVLEMRRYEKNYFLYRNKEDLNNWEIYLFKAKKLLNNLNSSPEYFKINKDFEKIKKDFDSYENMVRTLKNTNSTSIHVLERKIRKNGSEILKFAEFLKLEEKKILLNYIASSKKFFLFFGLFLSLFAVVSLIVGYKLLVYSLQTLENEIRNILYGNSKEISVPSEFRHFVETFRKTYFTFLETEKLSSLGKLLFSIAHEINNPLSNISTTIEILKNEDIDNEFRKELFNDLENEVERTKNIVHSVLDFCKVKEKTYLNLKKCIEDTVKLMKGYIPNKISVKIEIPENIKIFGNKSQIQQIFVNLIKNAIEAIKDEGEIQIKAVTENGKVKIMVKDTGEGIAPQNLSKIFEPFFSTREKSGYGIGLFVVYNLVKEHEGNIYVESRLKEGTTFYIEFPLIERSGVDGKV